MKFHTLFLATALLAAFAAGCAKKPEESAKVNAAGAVEEPARPVRSIVVGRAEMGEALHLPGEIKARHEQRLGFRVGGKIATRSVEVGQLVKAGTILATMDAADVMPQINAQAAQLEVAKVNTQFQISDLQRQQELRDKGFISAAAIQRQQTTADSARAQEQAAASILANARNALAFQTLRADRPGVVIGVDAEAGSVVAAGQSVVRLAQTGEIEVTVNVPERSVNALRDAKSLDIVIDAIPGKMYSGTLRELGPSADPVTRTFPARLAIKASDAEIKLGMTATVRATLNSNQVLVVPLSAIATRDGQQKVWVVDAAQTVQPVAITTGAIVGESITVASGLNPGQRVVTAGANLLISGQKVRVLDAANAPIPAAQNTPKLEGIAQK